MGLIDIYSDDIAFISTEEVVQKYGAKIVRTLYKFAKEDNNIEAQINLAELYYRNKLYRDILKEELHDGEDYDRVAEALEWALMAANNRTPGINTDNSSAAYYYSGVLYEEQGNYKEATFWFNLASRTGTEYDAYNRLEKVQRKLIFIAVLKKLTDESHTEAQLIWESVPHKDVYNNQATAEDFFITEIMKKKKQLSV